ncbi:hypothetical protein PBI_REDNO2_70 [Mycobacterium phage Redno2]|uniref:Uncharacterized protein n=1 Tax=Mycobacterium phage Superphikiman TaxID=2041551 RepID=A0A2D2W3Z8_9CAUD|nr:hypothetical protein N860_gp070 [Mycobacterium phage Redno2]YP_009213291.1 hypothetical protein AVV70_gp074 [Mycobacterium phage MiaZeal]ASD50707.1 hypothetical protein PORCELAIN_73 [Mycobacterium phage Porcelain]ASZ74150.1 hypothetical protein SEA_SQUINT_74 [Mycobacterium phage Squint]ATN88881.1 hypothetical protein SEA_DMPSTRDIVER_73 [Mycobacterium phage DmpstrDiver]ATS92914.1 hypothetical protein SEA_SUPERPHIKIMAN_71 [Mycobacterium phage Superphikiman]AWH13886.1 hypothetical protein SEA
MSGELRAVLTEAIKAHKPTTKRINHPRRQEFLLNLDACMGCEWTEQDGGDHDSHVADVIASLPGVAVIQLPEPDVDEYGNTTFADGTVVTFKDGWTQLRLEDIGRDDCYDWDDDQLRDFGAALLAAAAAAVAEGEDRE